MTSAFKKSPGVGNWTEPGNRVGFQEANFKGQFSSHHLTKERNKEPTWPQDKMLSIANYYRNDANQNDNKQSNPI